jgi:GntR family transcriptional regulator
MGQPLASIALDPNSPVPLWSQLEGEIRRRLHNGEYGKKFPSEREHAEEFGLDLATVRKAIARIVSDGLLGGSTVTIEKKSATDEKTWGVSSIALTLAAIGVTESSVVRARGIELAEDHGEALGISPVEKVVHIERLRLADGQPLALDRSWLPLAVAQPLLAMDLSFGSIYSALATSTGVVVSGGSEKVRPHLPDQRDRELLGIPPGEAVFSLERVAIAQDQPVELRHSVLRGDRFELTSSFGRLTPGSQPRP